MAERFVVWRRSNGALKSYPGHRNVLEIRSIASDGRRKNAFERSGRMYEHVLWARYNEIRRSYGTRYARVRGPVNYSKAIKRRRDAKMETAPRRLVAERLP